MLLLTIAAFYLSEDGQVNAFPTYIAGVAFLPFLFRADYLDLVDRKTLISIFAFLAYMTLSVTWAIEPEHNIARYFGYSVLLVGFVVGIPIMCHLYQNFLSWILRLLVLSASVSAIYSIALHYVLPEYQPYGEDRLFALGRLSNPVVAALAYGSAVVVSLNLMISSRRAGSLVWLVMLSALIWAIALTGTHGVWLGMFPAILITLFFNQDISRNKARTISVIAILSVIGFLVVELGLWEEMSERSSAFPPAVWEFALQQTLDAGAIFGKGVGTEENLVFMNIEFPHTHSIYVSTFFHGGVIGILLLGWMLFSIAMNTFRCHDMQLKTLVLSTAAFGLGAVVFDGGLVLTKVNFLWIVFWFPLALGMVTTLPEYREPSKEPA